MSLIDRFETNSRSRSRGLPSRYFPDTLRGKGEREISISISWWCGLQQCTTTVLSEAYSTSHPLIACRVSPGLHCLLFGNHYSCLFRLSRPRTFTLIRIEAFTLVLTVVSCGMARCAHSLPISYTIQALDGDDLKHKYVVLRRLQNKLVSCGSLEEQEAGDVLPFIVSCQGYKK